MWNVEPEVESQSEVEEEEEEEDEDAKPKTEENARVAPETIVRVGEKTCLEIQLGFSRVELSNLGRS